MSTVIPAPDNWLFLLGSWAEIRHGYHTGDKDETVRGCARRLDTTVPGPEGDPGQDPRRRRPGRWKGPVLPVGPTGPKSWHWWVR
ncbi:hypothetical protein QC281_34590 [Streptomyces sp. DH17]|nr:hypothetical protein [Streptomyces sp. DH17]